MPEEQLIQHVEVSFVSAPPVRQVELASGVSGVAVDGRILRCVVRGSFQPFLEALHGYEVISLKSEWMKNPGPAAVKESPQARVVRVRKGEGV